MRAYFRDFTLVIGSFWISLIFLAALTNAARAWNECQAENSGLATHTNLATHTDAQLVASLMKLCACMKAHPQSYGKPGQECDGPAWYTAVLKRLRAQNGIPEPGQQLPSGNPNVANVQNNRPQAATPSPKGTTCNGTVTSNGCVPNPVPPSNAPTSVTIGPPSPPSGGSSSQANNGKNVPTPCQDLNGSASCRPPGTIPEPLSGGRSVANVEDPYAAHAEAEKNFQNYNPPSLAVPPPQQNASTAPATPAPQAQPTATRSDPCAHPQTWYWRDQTPQWADDTLTIIAKNLADTPTCLDRRQGAEAYRELAMADACLASLSKDAGEQQKYTAKSDAMADRAKYIDDVVDKDYDAGKCGSQFAEQQQPGPPAKRPSQCSATPEQIKMALEQSTYLSNQTPDDLLNVQIIRAIKHAGCDVPTLEQCDDAVHNGTVVAGCRTVPLQAKAPVDCSIPAIAQKFALACKLQNAGGGETDAPPDQ